MNPRERFWRTMRFEPVDHLPFWADWLGPFERWHGEGLPAEVNEKDRAVAYFGFDGMYSAFWGVPRAPVSIGLCPGFSEETLDETADYRTYRNSAGVVVRQFRVTGSLRSTQFLAHPLRTRDDWLRLRDERLDPAAPGRYPPEEEWAAFKRWAATRDAPLSIDGGSFYGFIRDWMGVEALSYLLYDQPELFGEMVEYLGDFYIKVLRRAVEEVEIDFAMFWEDMCYNAGPLLSPAMFREFLVPQYQKVTRFLEAHGVRLSWVDCDGNIEALLPLWIEGGVRGHYPLEVASAMDAAKLRREYGREIVLWGNVDKRALTAGKEAIDAELERLAPVAAEGGFIPLVDHGVPDDVPYAHYLYYLERRKAMF